MRRWGGAAVAEEEQAATLKSGKKSRWEVDDDAHRARLEVAVGMHRCVSCLARWCCAQ